MITPDKIKELISTSLKSEELNCWHGINNDNIEEHCQEPTKEVYFDTYEIPIKAKSFTEKLLQFIKLKEKLYKKVEDRYELFTVLHEYPKEKQGYTVAFNPEDNLFHLGRTGMDGRMYILGDTGTFVEILNVM